MSILLFLQEEILLEYVTTGVIMVSKEYFLKENKMSMNPLFSISYEGIVGYELIVAPASTSVIKGLSVFLE